MWSATALMCYLCYCDASVMLSYCATVISCFQIITAMVMLWLWHLQFCYLVSLCKEGKNWPFSSLGLGSPREWGVDPLWQGKNSWRAQQSCLATRVLGAGGGRLVIGLTPSPSQSPPHPPVFLLSLIWIPLSSNLLLVILNFPETLTLICRL